MPPEIEPCTNKRESAFQEWLDTVNTLAAAATPQSLVSLLKAFYEQGWTGKNRVVLAFKDKPDTLIYPVLERTLRDNENAGLRNAAMEIYVTLGGRSLPPLCTLLRDSDEEIRCFAGVMLGDLKNKGSVPELIRALSDPDLNVKHAAAEALGKIKDSRAVESLIEALHTDMWLQFPAAVALGEIGDARAVLPLTELLDTPGANVPAIQALGKIGDPSALNPLCTFLEAEESSLREWALEAVAGLLVRDPDKKHAVSLSPKAEDTLLQTLRSDSQKARRNAVVVLGCFRITGAVPALTGLLTDRDLREDALEAIVRIGGEAALGELTAFCRDSDPLVRRAAVEALAGLGTKRSMQAVLPLLSDPAEDVRMEAALALARFNTDEARRALAETISGVTDAAYEAEKGALEALATLSTRPTAPFAFNPSEIRPLRDYISERLGLYYDDERLNVLHHRLSPLAAAGGFRSLCEYHQHLINTSGSMDAVSRLASQLTNNETYFFRETDQLKSFMRSVLPELIQKKRANPQKSIRVLSAGCSSGEEAYTAAILLHEAEIRAQGCGFEVLGLDIDPGSLERAKQARYPSRSFRGNINGLVKKYFAQDGDWFVVSDRIRSLVQFRPGNVLNPTDIGRFDIILCRNVLIYFSDSSIERAAKNFHQMLVPGGHLLLGHSESFCRINTDFVPVRLEGVVVYQKQ
jgi:chemotaxis protein methyltransferase CheR